MATDLPSDREMELLDGFIEWFPGSLDTQDGQQGLFTLLFYEQLHDDAARQPSDMYRLTYNPVNHQVVIYEDGDQRYNSRADDTDADDAYWLARVLLGHLDERPPLLDAVAGDTDLATAVGEYILTHDPAMGLLLVRVGGSLSDTVEAAVDQRRRAETES